MNALRALAGGALWSYPSEFRRSYGEDILRDIEAEPERFAHNLFKILKEGLAMRLEDFGRDLNYAVARLRRAPLFVAIVTLTFALGIGANVAVFSAFNAIVLRPLPFPNAGRLVVIGKRTAAFTGPLAPLDLSDLRGQLQSVVSISGIIEARATMMIDGAPKAVRGAKVGATFFRTIDAAPEIGRFFDAADGRAGRHSVVISDRLWRTGFNGDLAALGKHVSLDGIAYTVVGVTRPDAEAPEPSVGETVLAQPDYFTAVPDASPSDERRHVTAGYLGAVADLAPGKTVAHLNAELLVASSRVQALYPRNADNGARITFVAQPLAEQLIGRVASSLWMILFVVFGILLVACANVANLIGTRWSAREREVAIRRALGATRRRIAAQLFIETGVLASCGGVAGLVVAYSGLQFIPVTVLDAMPRAHTISIDPTTLLYAVLMVCVTTVLAGFAPVLSLGRAELQLMVNSAGRWGDTSSGRGLRSALVIGEVAIALALVISSGLLVRSFVTLLHAPLGFRADGVYVAPFAASDTDDSRSWGQAAARQRRLLERVGALPGVDAAALSLTVPLAGAFGSFVPQVDGTNGTTRRGMYATQNFASPAYFRALGVPLLRGRAFADGDSATSAPVAIVSRGFADTFLLGGDAIGRRIKNCAACRAVSVVGVVPDMTQRLNQPPLPTMYIPSAQHPPPIFTVVVHAPHTNILAARKAIQPVFAALFPQKVPPEVYTVSDVIAIKTQTQRFTATLLGALALIPLLLALSGIYGVVSFSAGQRSHEFGVRMALGAKARSILGDILRRSLITTAIGVAIGTVLAALDARAIAPYLTARPDFSSSFAGLAPKQLVSPFDPLTFGVVIALIFVCTAIAALVPAMRAARVDPVVALRYE